MTIDVILAAAAIVNAFLKELKASNGELTVDQILDKVDTQNQENADKIKAWLESHPPTPPAE